MSVDYQNVETVGLQVSADGQRVWVCVDGTCALRVKGISEGVGITDDRESLAQEQAPILKKAFMTIRPDAIEYRIESPNGDVEGAIEPADHIGIILEYMIVHHKVDSIEFERKTIGD